VHISARPTEAEDRAVPGHWEGDLLFGKGMSPIATLVERSTRFVLLSKLGHHDSETVTVALAHHIQTLPVQLRRSLTWDQGLEMARHAQFTLDSGVQVFFCDPKSPWQRGSNENTNGLLRQYFPRKVVDFHAYTQADLDAVASRSQRSASKDPRLHDHQRSTTRPLQPPVETAGVLGRTLHGADDASGEVT
jgi:IS30 family transposase